MDRRDLSGKRNREAPKEDSSNLQSPWRVAEEPVYDASNAHAYTLFRTYNERGDLLTETNRLGQKAIYTYDMKGQIKTACNFSNRLEMYWLHDSRGRVKAKTEKGDDGIIHKTLSEYDFHDRKIWEQDPFGNQTRYTQDLIANKVVKTDFPPILSIEVEPLPVTTGATYHPLGRELTLTDANGNTTCYRRNAYGAPTEIIYPHGGREIFRYTKGGQLRDHTDLDGLTIHYERDIFGRVLFKTYFSSESDPIAKETFTYSAFHLLTETDKERHTQYYTYDGAGRKIQEAFCGRVTDFYYDKLSRIATICKRNGDNSLFLLTVSCIRALIAYQVGNLFPPQVRFTGTVKNSTQPGKINFILCLMESF